MTCSKQQNHTTSKGRKLKCLQHHSFDFPSHLVETVWRLNVPAWKRHLSWRLGRKKSADMCRLGSHIHPIIKANNRRERERGRESERDMEGKRNNILHASCSFWFRPRKSRTIREKTTFASSCCCFLASSTAIGKCDGLVKKGRLINDVHNGEK